MVAEVTANILLAKFVIKHYIIELNITRFGGAPKKKIDIYLDDINTHTLVQTSKCVHMW